MSEDESLAAAMVAMGAADYIADTGPILGKSSSISASIKYTGGADRTEAAGTAHISDGGYVEPSCVVCGDASNVQRQQFGCTCFCRAKRRTKPRMRAPYDELECHRYGYRLQVPPK